MAVIYNSTEVLDALVQAGSDANRKGNGGKTALMTAAQHGGVEEVVVLLRTGADPTAKDESGWTAFDWGQDNEDLEGAEVY